MTLDNIPIPRPSLPRIVQQAKILHIAGDEDAATLRRHKEMLFISGGFHPQLTRGENIMPRRAEERGNFL